MKLSGNMVSRPLATVLVSMALVACGPDNPETQLKDAGKHVEKAEHNVEAARKDVQSAADDLQTLQGKVNEAQAQLANEQEQLASKRGDLAAGQDELHDTASNTAIFRLIQTQLLAESSLSTAAISVEVIDGEVTLRGEVDNLGQKETAARIASDTPGVVKVVNLVEVPVLLGAPDSGNP